MGEIVDEIAALVAARRGRLHEVRAEIAWWRRADAAVEALREAVKQLSDYHVTPPEIGAQLDRLRNGTARLSITRAIELMQRLEARLARGTICIGVSGAARAGKSTLLQSISGLTDAQLPTGAAPAVTAVPSLICHTPGRRRAVIALHSFDTFRTVQLKPRYLRAGLGEPPTDVDAFRAAKYPETNQADHVRPLRELRTMQAALWSYEGLLDRPDRELELIGDELDRLAEYVTFPDSDARADGTAARRYLAVRNVQIECPFPRAEHGAIELVDLPGLSASPVDADRQQRGGGLGYEIDVLLLIKRTAAITSGPDAAPSGPAGRPPQMMRERADDHAGRRRDLVLLVHNTNALAGMSTNRPDQAAPRILEVNGKEPVDVSARLLTPVLRHLVDRLPALDEDLYVRTQLLTRPAWDELVGLAAEAKAVLTQVPPMTRDTAKELYRRTDSLSASFSGALRRLLTDLRARAAVDEADFRGVVLHTHAELVEWARDGLGQGRERWRAEALRRTVRDRASGAFAAAQLTRARVEISRRHAAALDQYLGHLLRQTWTDLADAVRGQLGTLLSDRSGDKALAYLAELAERSAEPCRHISAAISDLLAVRLDYRTHLHPRVWSEADPLVGPVPEVPATEEGVEHLCQIASARAECAATRVHVRLLAEATLPGKVLCAAVTRFADALFASETAEREIRRLARGYRGDLWADLLPELDGADAKVTQVARAADQLLAATTEWNGPIG